MGRKKQGGVSKKVLRPNPDASERNAALRARVIERPDGFYWESKEERAEHGPFATLAEAEADMLSGGAPVEADDGETLQEAESEIGIAEWIDPDTGGPAEDSVPRIEDH
jgi:hypothetical protein